MGLFIFGLRSGATCRYSRPSSHVVRLACWIMCLLMPLKAISNCSETHLFGTSWNMRFSSISGSQFISGRNNTLLLLKLATWGFLERLYLSHFSSKRSSSECQKHRRWAVAPIHETCIYTENVSVQLVQLVHGYLALTTPGFDWTNTHEKMLVQTLTMLVHVGNICFFVLRLLQIKIHSLSKYKAHFYALLVYQSVEKFFVYTLCRLDGLLIQYT